MESDWRGRGETTARLRPEAAGMRPERRVCRRRSPCSAPPGWAVWGGRALPGGSPSEQRQGVIFVVRKSYKHKCNPIEVMCPNKKKTNL